MKNKNKHNNKTFQELYNKTIERENDLINLGYKIIKMWEYDWDLLCEKK